MVINFKLKSLLTVALLMSFSSFAKESIAENNSKAPKATAADAAISFWDLPHLKKAFIDTTPADRKDALVVGELGIDGGNKEMIVKLAKEIADNNHGDYDSLLIAHKGKFLFESYYKRGRINLPHFQASATKGYTGLVIGRAIQLGYLTMADLDKPLVNFIKGLDPTKFVKGAEKITLHKAMTMSSGLRFSDEQMTEFRENPEQFKGLKQVQAFLELSEPITSKSQVFKYQGPDPIMVMQVLDAVVPGSAKDFIKNEFIDKLGINNYTWRNDLSGMPIADSRVSMTSRDMLKLGALIINEGQLNGEQLLSADYLAKATSAITRPTEDWQPKTFFYGYLWYQTDISVGNKHYDVKLTWGAGGNRIIVIDELDLVVVITGHDREDAIFAQVEKIILPAFVKDEFPPLEGRYFSQKPPGLTPELFAPGIIATQEYRETVVTFSPNMKEFSFTRSGGKYKKPTLFVMQNEKNRWSSKAIPPTETKKYAEKFNPKFTEIKSLEPFKDIPIIGSALSAKGTYYFYVLDFKDGSGHMSYSRLINGKYEKPQKMNKGINTGKYIAHPFIAPDESYLIWDAEKEDEDTPDIYISFRQKDGSWGAAINMGDKINTAAYEQHARVTPDGKYLFFLRAIKKIREDGSIYFEGNPHWVDAQFIENLRPKESSFTSIPTANNTVSNTASTKEKNGTAPETSVAEVKR